MKRRRIAKRWCKIPQTLKDVTLKQFIEFEKHNSKRLELTKRQEESDSEEEQSLLDYQIIDAFDSMVSDISSIPYQYLSQIPLNSDKRQKIYSWFEPIIDIMKYSFDAKKSINKFKHKKQTFYLFEFDYLSAQQMLFFETYWKKFYEVAAKEVTNMNFNELSRLVAICAFKKGEINMMISNRKELPTEIKPEYYGKFGNLIEERNDLFKDLPLNIVYGCLNFFFVNTINMQKNTKTYTLPRIMLN